MKYKLCLTMILSFFLMIPTCFAKVIRIDNIDYNVQPGEILTKKGLIYNSNQNLLILTNSKYQSIYTKENLKIVLNGDNILKSDNLITNIIMAKNLEIVGPGSLTIEGNNLGISALNVVITNAKINLKTKNRGIAASYDGGNIILNNTTLEATTDDAVFGTVNGDLSLNNSQVKINQSDVLFGGFTKNIYLNSSNLILNCQNGIMYNGYQIYIFGNSHFYMQAIKNHLNKSSYILGSNLQLLGSNDGLNYHEIESTEKNNYLKIDYLGDDELDLKEKEDYLKQKEQELINKEIKLKKLEINLIEKQKLLNNQEINLQEQENKINDKLVNLDTKEKSLIKKEICLINLQINLTKKDKLLSNKNLELKNEEKSLTKKLNNLSSKEKELLKKKDLLKELEINLNTLKVNLENREKILKEKEEKLNDVNLNCQTNSGISTDSIKKTKTYFDLNEDLLRTCFLFLGIITIIIIGKYLLKKISKI